MFPWNVHLTVWVTALCNVLPLTYIGWNLLDHVIEGEIFSVAVAWSLVGVPTEEL